MLSPFHPEKPPFQTHLVQYLHKANSHLQPPTKALPIKTIGIKSGKRENTDPYLPFRFSPSSSHQELEEEYWEFVHLNISHAFGDRELNL
ncbi:hypothetical protein CEXT_563751 [Caerostris extrusa]|uniref:Uncharacterized protein n=1 Tax=Caerostris extrusa TaxID=172846 RepID=A0AAV4P1R8_CAEEX|nr:hypothetical protein CEXT_563751 [Caerostris extrusa]